MADEPDLSPRAVLKGRPRSLYARLWEGEGLRREDYLTLQEAAAYVGLTRRQLPTLLRTLGITTMAAPEDLRLRLVPKTALDEFIYLRERHRSS